MLMQWFNAWFEARLAVAIGLAADLRATVDGPPSGGFREATPEEVAAIARFLSENDLRPRTANVVPFPAARHPQAEPPPDPPPSAA